VKNVVEPIGLQARLDERRRSFIAEAAATDAQMLATGEGHAAEDVRRHFLARMRREKCRRPKPINRRI